MMILRIIVLVVLLAGGLAAADAIEITEKSEALYARAGSFKANFIQVVATGDFFDDEETAGILLMEYPDRFRLETPEQVITCDGDTLWSYSVENKQVLVEPVSQVGDMVTPADYLFNFKENYEIEFDTTLVEGEVEMHRLNLRAKDDDQYVRSLQLYVSTENYAVVRVVYKDINENQITIDFSDLKLGIDLDKKDFRFKPPRGVEEVRLP
ncbi:MAG: outer membrane lipoprotein carrier protein LolA [candidate division Zixibacteria bacterium]|nr:outer membrane lipoprotein carrier protein LolA [candidate division Zixibacteria bacterium]